MNTTTELLPMLRRITEAQTAFFYQNEHGSHDAFQRAADEMHDAIDAARDWLQEHDEPMPPGYPGECPEGMDWSAWLAMNNVD